MRADPGGKDVLLVSLDAMHTLLVLLLTQNDEGATMFIECNVHGLM